MGIKDRLRRQTMGGVECGILKPVKIPDLRLDWQMDLATNGLCIINRHLAELATPIDNSPSSLEYAERRVSRVVEQLNDVWPISRAVGDGPAFELNQVASRHIGAIAFDLLKKGVQTKEDETLIHDLCRIAVELRDTEQTDEKAPNYIPPNTSYCSTFKFRNV